MTPKTFDFDEYDSEMKQIEGSAEDISALRDDIDKQEAEILAEFGAAENDVNWLIKMYRIQERSKNMPWLFDCQPADLPILPYLRDHHGTGNYEARVYKNGKLHRKLTYAVEAPKAIAPQVQSGNSNPELSHVATALQQQSQLIEKLFDRISNQSQFQQQQPQDSLSRTMEAVAGLMAGMRGMIPKQQDPSTKMFEMMMKGMEIANGAQKGESNWIDLVRDALKDMKPMLGQMAMAAQMNQTAAANNPVARPGLPGPTQKPNSGAAPKPNIDPAFRQQPERNLAKEQILKAQQEANGNEQDSGEIDDEVISMLAAQLSSLVENAKKGSDPGLYAEFILDNAPDELLEHFIWRHDLKELLSQYNAEVPSYWLWFEQLISAVRNYLTEDREADKEMVNEDHAGPDHVSRNNQPSDNANGPSAGASRDKTDAGTNEPSGKGGEKETKN